MRILIGLCTYNKPHLVVQTLASLLRMERVGADFDIVVCDNSETQSAKTPIIDFCEREGVKNLIYLHCKERGVTHARNTILKYANVGAYDENISNEDANAYDALAFIDDDEEVSPQWLANYVEIFKTQNPDFICGPVFPKLETQKPWFKHTGFYAPPNRSEGFLFGKTVVGCGNVIISLAKLREISVHTEKQAQRPLIFDERFNRSGGEDVAFFYAFQKYGARGYWASNATVFETLEPNRYSFQYFTKRSFGLANAGVRAHTAVFGWLETVSHYVFKAIAHITIGTIMTLIGLIYRKCLYRGIRHFCVGVGQILGLMNICIKNY